MTAAAPINFLRAVRRYAGKIQTLRNEIRTARFMNTLPEEIRKDIGWPDNYAGSRARRS